MSAPAPAPAPAPAAPSPLTVSGPTLALRLARPDDAPALFELGRDPEVTRFFSWGPYREVEEPLAYVRLLERQREEGSRLEFLVERRDGEAVGVTGLSEFSRRDRRAVVGTWLGRRFWGTGANAESKALVLALAFRGLGLLRVSALASPDNPRSLSALARLGFEAEGTLRSWQVHHGEPRDCVILGLLRERWAGGALAELPVDIAGDLPPAFQPAPDPR